VILTRDYRQLILSEAAYGGLPVAYWPMAEARASIIYDLMPVARGTAYNQSLTGVASFGVGGLLGAGDAIHFGGGIASGGDIRPVSFTLEAWIYPTSNGIYPGILMKSPAYSEEQAQFALYLHGTSGKPTVTVKTSTGVQHAKSVLLNRWNHVAATRNGSTFTVYLNGDPTTTTSFGNPSAGYTADPVCIGGWSTSTTNGRFTGRMCHAAIYDYALPPARLRAHYEAGISDGPLEVPVLWDLPDAIEAYTPSNAPSIAKTISLMEAA
jgi:hypothetical protein